MTINELSKRTDGINEAMAEAAKSLARPAYTNGFGIVSDPSAALSNVIDAQAALKRAHHLLRASWPTDADYDAMERQHNRGEV